MRHINILGLSLLLFTIGASAKSDLDREGLIGPVQSIVYNDTQKSFPKSGRFFQKKMNLLQPFSMIQRIDQVSKRMVL